MSSYIKPSKESRRPRKGGKMQLHAQPQQKNMPSMMLETEFSSKVDNQLCRQNWKNVPNQQMIGSLSAAPVEDDIMGEVTPDKGKGHERRSDGDDTNMEVKVFHYVLYTLISVIGFI